MINLAKSNARLKELEEAYAKEKANKEELLAKRYEIYKYEKVQELRNGCNGKLPNKKNQIELYYAQGICYEEISLLIDSKLDYIYKVVCNYKKKNGLNGLKSEYTEIETLIIEAGRHSNKTVAQIAKALGCCSMTVCL